MNPDDDDLFEPPDITAEDDAPEAVPVSGSVEYRAADNTIWRCEGADRLCGDYFITGTPQEMAARLREWHEAMSSLGTTWHILRRYYSIAPLLGDTLLADMREWTVQEIAAEQDVESRDIERHLVETQQHWSRAQLANGLAQRLAKESKPQLSDADARDLMRRYGFDAVKEAEDREYVLVRITELSHLLELEAGRPLALSAIFQELILRSLQKRLLEIMGNPSKASEAAKLAKEYTDAQGQYEETMKRLGATQEQNPGFRRKVAFNDCVGQITKAMQEYYGKGNTALIDGLFTEAEVQLLLTPTPLRPPQYRPDIALLAVEWRKQFWNAGYDGDKLPRKGAKLLFAAMEAAVRAATGTEVVDDSPLAEESDSEMRELEISEALGLPEESTVEAGVDDGTDGELPEPAAMRQVRNAGSDNVPM